MPPSILKGYDALHGVRDIRIEGLTVGGRPILSATEGLFFLRQAYNVMFAPASVSATKSI